MNFCGREGGQGAGRLGWQAARVTLRLDWQSSGQGSRTNGSLAVLPAQAAGRALSTWQMTGGKRE
jgi:hypothetical protein